MLDTSVGGMFVGDGASPGGRFGCAINQIVLSSSATIATGYSAYWPMGVEIPAGMTLEIGAGAVAEVG